MSLSRQSRAKSENSTHEDTKRMKLLSRANARQKRNDLKNKDE